MKEGQYIFVLALFGLSTKYKFTFLFLHVMVVIGNFSKLSKINAWVAKEIEK